jgi:UDP-3-O-[3-hydroxymyristoyl] glucosamine N-acyltransferase
MYQQTMDAYYAVEIAEFLNLKLRGDNCILYHPCSLENIKDNSVMFLSKRVCVEGFDFRKLEGFSSLLLIVPDGLKEAPPCCHIVSAQPRLDFVRVLHRFFVKEVKPMVHPTATVESGAKIGRNVYIGPHVHIGSEVEVGDETQIFANVVISGKVLLGNRCVIKPNTTIGSEGFSFVTDSENLEHFPQIGVIVIGNHVWIGANSTIERAALDATTIGDDVKIDDLVQIGHNVTIGRACQITAGTVLCGRVKLGERVWIAPNATIDSDVKIGDKAFIGMGAVVLKDVESNAVMVGNPARYLKNRADIKPLQ